MLPGQRDGDAIDSQKTVTMGVDLAVGLLLLAVGALGLYRGSREPVPFRRGLGRCGTRCGARWSDQVHRRVASSRRQLSHGDDSRKAVVTDPTARATVNATSCGCRARLAIEPRGDLITRQYPKPEPEGFDNECRADHDIPAEPDANEARNNSPEVQADEGHQGGDGAE
jgi:hypothetical protein